VPRLESLRREAATTGSPPSTRVISGRVSGVSEGGENTPLPRGNGARGGPTLPNSSTTKSSPPRLSEGEASGVEVTPPRDINRQHRLPTPPRGD
jgi:hypothetical protein